jgi:hypothetical protein
VAAADTLVAEGLLLPADAACCVREAERSKPVLAAAAHPAGAASPLTWVRCMTRR